jgi:hypothetical protein
MRWMFNVSRLTFGGMHPTRGQVHVADMARAAPFQQMRIALCGVLFYNIAKPVLEQNAPQ